MTDIYCFGGFCTWQILVASRCGVADVSIVRKTERGANTKRTKWQTMATKHYKDN